MMTDPFIPFSMNHAGVVELLAQHRLPDRMPDWGTRAQEVFDGWQNTRDVFPIWPLLVIGGAVLLTLGCVWLKQWWRSKPKDPTSSVVFRRLAGELGVGWADQLLLRQVARQQQLPSPLTLMACPGTLMRCCQAYVEHLPPARRAGVADRLSQIAQRLFGSADQAGRDIDQLVAAMAAKAESSAQG